VGISATVAEQIDGTIPIAERGEAL